MPDPRSSQRPSQSPPRPAMTITMATSITMVGMALSKITGFLREIFIVPKFGYGPLSDAYVFSFQIPDFIYELMVGGAVAATITPALAAGIERERRYPGQYQVMVNGLLCRVNQEKKAWYSVNILLSFFLLILIGVLIMAYLFMPMLVPLMLGRMGEGGKELDQATMALICSTTRILLFQTICMAVISALQGILQAYGRFGKASFGSSIYNVSYLTVLLLLGDKSPEAVTKVAWGVVFSASLYLIYQAFLARHELPFFYFKLDLQDPDFRRLFRLAIPILLSSSVMQLNVIIMNSFTAGQSGQATTLRQANTTWSLPYTIFVVAIGSVILPSISQAVSLRQHKTVIDLYYNSLRQALFFVVPCAVAFATLSFDTIQAIFQWNPATYSNADVAVTAGVLPIFCLTLLGQSVIFISNQTCYAYGLTKISLFNGLAGLILNPFFCWLFTRKLDFGVKGLALASALYTCMMAAALYMYIARRMGSRKLFPITSYSLRLAIAAAFTFGITYAWSMTPLYPTHKIFQLVVYGLKVLICFASYFITCLALDLREAVLLQNKIRAVIGLPPVRSSSLRTRSRR